MIKLSKYVSKDMEITRKYCYENENDVPSFNIKMIYKSTQTNTTNLLQVNQQYR